MKHGHYHRCFQQLWGMCCDSFSSCSKDKAQPRFIVDCVVYTMICYEWQLCERMVQKIQEWVHWCAWQRWSRMTLNCDWWTPLKSTNACMENVLSWYQKFPKNFHKLRGLLCIELSWTDWVTISTVHSGYQNNWLSQNTKNGVSLDVSSAPLGRGERISWQNCDWWRDLVTVHECRDQRAV